ncbi:MAG: glutathione peroxidase [Candidatus Caenarcaniphilales bacterium]|nr:glutathione peroxidase [Candidatus Caenarcaniphilales bacterium]
MPVMSDSNDRCSGVLNHKVRDIHGGEVDLCNYQGKALLVVNTASKCGFTGQYDDLQKLYEIYHSRGFEVLAFPSNDFAAQEPGDNQQIAKFCTVNYKITFPLFAKINVKGKEQSPFYSDLEKAKGGVVWNFQKYLIDRNGKVIGKFAPWTNPMSEIIQREIEKIL